MMTEHTVDGMTEAQVCYNVYAFAQDVKRYARKRDAARTPQRKEAWEQKRAEALTYLENNQRRLAAFSESKKGQP